MLPRTTDRLTFRPGPLTRWQQRLAIVVLALALVLAGWPLQAVLAGPTGARPGAKVTRPVERPVRPPDERWPALGIDGPVPRPVTLGEFNGIPSGALRPEGPALGEAGFGPIDHAIAPTSRALVLPKVETTPPKTWISSGPRGLDPGSAALRSNLAPLASRLFERAAVRRAVASPEVSRILNENLVAARFEPGSPEYLAAAFDYQLTVSLVLTPALRAMSRADIDQLRAGGLVGTEPTARKLAEAAREAAPALADVEVPTGKVTIKRKFRVGPIEFSLPSFNLFKVAGAALGALQLATCAFGGCLLPFEPSWQAALSFLHEHLPAAQAPLDAAFRLYDLAQPVDLPVTAQHLDWGGLAGDVTIEPFRLAYPRE